MKKIYLDTSNIALLTKIKKDTPVRFREFLGEWHYRKYILALSDAHFFEIMRCKFASERNARFDLIESFLPACFEQRLAENEIILALLLKEQITRISIKFFSEKIKSPSQFIKYKSLDNPFMRDVCNIKYEAFDIIWKLAKKDENLKNSRTTRFSELPDTKFAPENLEDFLIEGKQIIEEKIKSNISKYKNIPNETVEIEIENAFNAFEKLFTNISKFGMKQAFAECFEIDSTNRKIQRSFFYALINDFKLKAMVEAILRELFSDIYESQIRNMKSKVSLRNCPGTWLKTQVENQLFKAQQLEASNELDIYHLSHLPYVNLLFTDKRIVEMTNQVLRQKNLPKSLEKINAPVFISNTIENLEKELF